MKALACPNCGAPLPHPDTTTLASCAFFGVTCDLRGDRPSEANEKQAARLDAREIGKAFIEEMEAAVQRGESFLDVTRRLGRQHLGESEAEALVNIIGNLIYAFEAEEKCRVHDNAVATSRLVEAYFNACNTLAGSNTAEINLPFFTATDAGPLHYLRVVTAESLGELASRAPVAPAGEGESEKKGFFRRLFLR